MARLTFTLDQDMAARLEDLRRRAGSTAHRVRRQANGSLPDERGELLEEMAESLARLGEHPSIAHVVREALFYYFATLQEIEEAARLESGYRALAEDEERERVLFATRDRAAKTWADEP